jgi:hypothetical protein
MARDSGPTKHANVKAISHNTDLWSTELAGPLMEDYTTPEEVESGRLTLLGMDSTTASGLRPAENFHQVSGAARLPSSQLFGSPLSCCVPQSSNLSPDRSWGRASSSAHVHRGRFAPSSKLKLDRKILPSQPVHAPEIGDKGHGAPQEVQHHELDPHLNGTAHALQIVRDLYPEVDRWQRDLHDHSTHDE